MDTLVRVYNNGERVLRTYNNPANALDDLEYCKKYRVGCALFLNGTCIQSGYLDTERCKQLEEELKGV